MQNSMSEQQIIRADGLQPFRCSIGHDWTQRVSPVGGRAAAFAQRLYAQRGHVGLRHKRLSFHWLRRRQLLSPTTHVWQTEQTTVTHRHEQRRSFLMMPMTIRLHRHEQRRSSLLMPLTIRLPRRLQPNVVNQQRMVHSHRETVVFALLGQQITHLHHQISKVVQVWQADQAAPRTPSYHLNGRAGRQSVNSQMMQRIWQQGRRVEQSNRRQSSLPIMSGIERHLVQSTFRRERQKVKNHRIEQIVPVAEEVIGQKTDRFSQPASESTVTSLANIDGIQLQQLTDKIVRQIDQKIVAQRERMGRF
jgi:hypothetical protein